jgi:methyl-accepting chemotaxis protein
MERQLSTILTSAKEDGDVEAEYTASLTLRSLLLARLYAYKFFNSIDAEDRQRVEGELQSMASLLMELDESLQNEQRRALLAQVLEGHRLYTENFAEAADTLERREQLVGGQLEVLGPQIAATALSVFESVQSDQNALGPRLQRANARAIRITLAAAAAAVLLGLGLSVFITRSILGQLGADPTVIERITGRISKGDLDIKIPEKDLRGVYLSVKEMVDALRYKAEIVDRIAANDLSVRVEAASDEDRLGLSLQTMKSSLNELLGEVNGAVVQVTSGADQVSQASQDLSQGATEQASSLEEITSSTNEINSQSKQNAENAKEAHALAKQATEDAQNGNDQMVRLSQIM